MPPPDPIWSGPSTWDLRASPSMLELAAQGLRGKAERLTSAQAVVDGAASSLAADEAWVGETADRYQGHRGRLTGDLGDLAAVFTNASWTLDEVASLLRGAQEQITTVRDGLAAVTHEVTETGVLFHPRDDLEATLVREAISAAVEIRTAVDEELVLKEAAFHSALREALIIEEAWAPTPVRVLDLNVGQGAGNAPFDRGGTDEGDLDEIGQIIVGSGADVVTLQEMFSGDANELRNWLNEQTGDTWEVHFAAASHKPQFDDAIGETVWNLGSPDTVQPFGNAILVRTGGGVAGSEELPELTLQEDSLTSPLDIGDEGRSMEGAAIDLTE